MACTPAQLASAKRFRENNRELVRARGRASELKRRQRGVHCGRVWEAKNPDKKAEINRRAVCRGYGLTLEAYNVMLDKQGGVCAICDSKDPRGYALSIDHDHTCCPGKRSCGKCVRGLLCSNCNPSLGGFKDNSALLLRAAAYLA